MSKEISRGVYEFVFVKRDVAGLRHLIVQRWVACKFIISCEVWL